MAYINGKEILFSPNINYGYDEGFEEGKTKEWSDFWDNAQKNGKQMTRYAFLFASNIWNGKTFRPKYSIKSNTLTSFANCFAYWTGEPISLIDRCAELGIEIDFSNANNLSSCFNSNLAVTEIGVVDTRNSTSNGGIFAYCTKLEKIEKIILKEDGTTSSFGDMFTQCYLLEEIRFEGVIGKSISFSYCELLTEASVANIIEHLMTITDGVARTLTLHATVKAKLTDEQKTTITTTKGWTLA